MGYEIDRSLWWNRPVWDLTNSTESRIRAAIARDITYPGNRSVSVSHRSEGVRIVTRFKKSLHLTQKQ